MSQNTEVYVAFPGVPSRPDQHLFGSVQEAIDSVEPGSTIILSAGDHSGIIRMKSNLHFIGLEGACIVSPVAGDASNVTFEKITFKNGDGCEIIDFSGGSDYVFRKCDFVVHITCG